MIRMRSSAILAIAWLDIFYCYNRQLSQPAMLLLTDDTRRGVTVSWAKRTEYKNISLTIPVLCTHSLLPLAIFLLILPIFHPFITLSTFIISIFWPCNSRDIILWMNREVQSNSESKGQIITHCWEFVKESLQLWPN